MHGRRNPFIAREGLPFIAIAIFALFWLIRDHEYWYVVPALALVFLYLLFRDPLRAVPSVALGVVCPVDGKVVRIDKVHNIEPHSVAIRIVIRVNSFGTYTARSPVEGKIMDLGSNALWVQTDEGDDVVLQFSGYRFGLAPRSFARFGERLGQGQRCAYLRLTRLAEVRLPADAKLLVEQGQAVVGGVDVIAALAHR